MPHATLMPLTPLSCTPNFPHAQYLDICMLMHELIIFKYTIIYKYGKRVCQLKIKRELKDLPSRNNGGRQKLLHTRVE